MLNYLVVFYLDFKKFNKADNYLSKVLDYNMESGNIWYNKACFESLRETKEKSIMYLTKAIELGKNLY